MISKEAKKKYDKEYRYNNEEKLKKLQREYYQKNKEKIKARIKKYRQENPDAEDKDKRKARSKRYRKKHSLKCRMAIWKRRGINVTYESYKEMFENQEGKCAICGVSESKLKYKLCLDHDHRDGSARGLLCRKCNSVLGMIERESEKDFRDPLPILKNAIIYISAKSEK